MKTIHILGGRNGFNHLLCINVRGQGQLHQDAVDAVVGVKGVDAGQQLGLGHGGRVLLQHGMQAAVIAGLDLVAHIHLGGRVFAHQHHGQAGCQATRAQGCGTAGDVSTELGGQGVSVDDLGGGGEGHGLCFSN